MSARIALLRGINVGGHAKIAMADLKALASDLGLGDPRTLLPELPCTTADLWVAGRLRNGNPVNLPEFSTAPLAKVFAGQRDLVAIVRRVAGTLFQPIVVLG